jgi:hypothetical protein
MDDLQGSAALLALHEAAAAVEKSRSQQQQQAEAMED